MDEKTDIYSNAFGIGSIFSPKELLLIIPLSCSALAITFDVGYFWGLDINLFTIFTLPEHVIFSVEALPYTILFVFLAVGSLIGYKLATGSKLKSVNVRGKEIYPIYYFVTVIAIVGLLYVLYVIFHRFGIIRLIDIGIVLIMFCTANLVSRSVATILTSFGVLLIISTFVAGAITSSEYLLDPIYRYLLTSNGHEVVVKIIRSGEKGLLYFD